MTEASLLQTKGLTASARTDLQACQLAQVCLRHQPIECPLDASKHGRSHLTRRHTEYRKALSGRPIQPTGRVPAIALDALDDLDEKLDAAYHPIALTCHPLRRLPYGCRFANRRKDDKICV